MNYIDRIAQDIYLVTDPFGVADERWLPLYRIYAVLALAKGEATTAEDVHDAWSAWCAGDSPSHRSLVPFDHLTEAVQRLDDPYVKAIHIVARRVRKLGVIA